MEISGAFDHSTLSLNYFDGLCDNTVHGECALPDELFLKLGNWISAVDFFEAFDGASNKNEVGRANG